MTASEFDKYLRFYRKTLREDPRNIEARLRLAALFREAGYGTEAAEAYAAASKMLGDEGLPLEAIAACKAALELEPRRRDVKAFMAQMFARIPDASDTSARVATPLEGASSAKDASRNATPSDSVIRTAIEELDREPTRRANLSGLVSAECARREADEAEERTDSPRSSHSTRRLGSAPPTEGSTLAGLDSDLIGTGDWDDLSFVDEIDESIAAE